MSTKFISLSVENEQAGAVQDGRIGLRRPNSQARTETGKYIFPVQLTTSRRGNNTYLIHTLEIIITAR